MTQLGSTGTLKRRRIFRLIAAVTLLDHQGTAGQVAEVKKTGTRVVRST